MIQYVHNINLFDGPQDGLVVVVKWEDEEPPEVIYAYDVQGQRYAYLESEEIGFFSATYKAFDTEYTYSYRWVPGFIPPVDITSYQT